MDDSVDFERHILHLITTKQQAKQINIDQAGDLRVIVDTFGSEVPDGVDFVLYCLQQAVVNGMIDGDQADQYRAILGEP